MPPPQEEDTAHPGSGPAPAPGIINSVPGFESGNGLHIQNDCLDRLVRIVDGPGFFEHERGWGKPPGLPTGLHHKGQSLKHITRNSMALRADDRHSTLSWGNSNYSK